VRLDIPAQAFLLGTDRDDLLGVLCRDLYMRAGRRDVTESSGRSTPAIHSLRLFTPRGRVAARQTPASRQMLDLDETQSSAPMPNSRLLSADGHVHPHTADVRASRPLRRTASPWRTHPVERGPRGMPRCAVEFVADQTHLVQPHPEPA
jgi:hypothetical protein